MSSLVLSPLAKLVPTYNWRKHRQLESDSMVASAGAWLATRQPRSLTTLNEDAVHETQW